MAYNILILGGKTEARGVGGAARRLIPLPDHLLARQAAHWHPAAQPVPVRVGGFGGPASLAAHLLADKDQPAGRCYPSLRCACISAIAAEGRPRGECRAAHAAPSANGGARKATEGRKPTRSRVRCRRWAPFRCKKVLVTLGRQELAPLEAVSPAWLRHPLGRSGGPAARCARRYLSPERADRSHEAGRSGS